MNIGPAARLWWGLGLSLALHAGLLGLARAPLPELAFRESLPSMAVVIEGQRPTPQPPAPASPTGEASRQTRAEAKTRPPANEAALPQHMRAPAKPPTAARAAASHAETPRSAARSQTPAPAQPPEAAKPPPALNRARIVARLQDELRARFTYPPLARRRNIQGRVLLGFGIDGTGTIHNVRIMRSSGHAILDLAAERAIRRLHRVQWYPAASGGQATEIELPVEYRLIPERGT